MKIHEISDIHLEYEGYDLEGMPEADVLILAGDVVRLSDMHRCDSQEHFEYWSKKYKNVLVVMGNHEHYKWNFETSAVDYRKFLDQFPNVTLLDNSYKMIEDVLFIGSTLWTNFSTPSHGPYDPKVVKAAQNHITDFHVIYKGMQLFDTLDSYNEMGRSWHFIQDTINAAEGLDPRKIVVITHFCPSNKSIHPKWGDDPCNHYFSNNAEELMTGVDLWFHGHTHSSFDYKVNDTRVICNPKGYRTENKADFKPKLVVEI